ncbi:hypothetical protein A2115_00890 [Candidatus Woesebacteria bacterium GWA1_41_8]|uniref:ATP-grasp domain-containing protein n=1 Tax=Candidatus Woesebacteria bacterium GWA1_41_8 TaxID=1802471 RepID=A0A1F7WI69_9BACT|nr:MAG: hypothetical protein A2115_00890 [Candidatus Woesebacteria bacterium GWA1_41_8]
MVSSNLKSLKAYPSMAAAIRKSPLIVGLGPSAWPRVITGFYFPKFKIVAYNDCHDNEIIRDFGMDVYSLKEKEPDLEISPETPGQILQTDLAKKYLKGFKKDFIFLVYKSSHILEKACEENGWRFIGNPKRLTETFENKKNFREIVQKVGLEPIPGENIAIEEMNVDKFVYFQRLFGKEKLVLQLAEVTSGGGNGTLFLDSPNGLPIFYDKVMEIRNNFEGKKKKIETVNVTAYIEGISSSISCCATQKGVLTGPIQTQIIDIKEVGTRMKGRSGNYAGSDWSFMHFTENSQYQADQIAQGVGEYMYKNGYKGIFGIDLLVEKSGKVWPVECNPRDTDAFPVVSMLMMDTGSIPLEVFHNLEHIAVKYDFDFEKVNAGYKRTPFEASQIILHNREDTAVVARNAFQAGVYKLGKNGLTYARPGFRLAELSDKNEFLFTENVPKYPGRAFVSHSRLFRMIRKGPMLLAGGGLRKEVKRAIEFVYRELKLVEAAEGISEDHGANFLFSTKLLTAKTHKELGVVDVVNVMSKTNNGFYRPAKIAWRKQLSGDHILDQIPSKRTRKHIRSDEKKLKEFGIGIKVYEDLAPKLFEDWLDLYRKIISEKSKADILIDKSWLRKKKTLGKKVGAILATKNGVVLGGNIFSEIGGILGVGFGVAERISGLSGGLGLLLDFHFMKYAQKMGYKEISFGQDTNFYGHDLSVGLISYKAKLGFIPKAANKTYFETTYLLNYAKFPDGVFFFNQNPKGALRLTAVTPKSEKDLGIYLPQGLQMEILNPDEVVKNHRNLFLAEV